ncbi:hypothetical protein PV371_12355 [Streptomyces sp. TX20-6-3]|uniref:hypothetical protein n=1 Tax=Streptomyces sp. TX20-6-3 TaxID=3028705 RepID=UPI0029BE133C|nr:hypothetical protein [Streptomyces sp. TX20-6-3]MDX2560434.1 hypothetical protein [Streptomyces sp. TX20-6-3]
MHGTRTTARILVGAAVAALAGCVSVDTPPPAPVHAPVAETVRPGQDVAPQIVEGPALEALEAALPGPPPSAAPRATPSPEPRRREAAPPRPQAPRLESVPPQHERPRPETRPSLPELPAVPAGLPRNAPVSRADVCELGERYGGWAPGSDPSRICHGTYGR